MDDRFTRRQVVFDAGDRRPYEAADWDDALVIVKRGEIDLECHAGGRMRFVAGDMLWLTGLPLRALTNPGLEPTVLVAISRRFAGALPCPECSPPSSPPRSSP